MTLFEYLSVAISVILSLSAAQLFSNLRAVFDPSRRYWVHVVYVAQMLFIHLITWWGFWAYRGIESWNLASFSCVLAGPALIFVSSSVLVAAPPGVGWEQHFEQTRRWFYVLRILLVLHASAREWFLLDRSILDPSLVGGSAVMLLFVAGIVSADRRVQAAVTIGTSLLLFVGLGYVRFQVEAL